MTEIETYTAKCPMCEKDVELDQILSTNTRGQDSDFFWNTSGANIIHHLISTCNDCLFSGSLEDFRRQYSRSEKRIISEELAKIKDEIKRGSWDFMVRQGMEEGSEELRRPVSYVISARWMRMLVKSEKLYERRWGELSRRPNLVLANTYLHASWCARDDHSEEILVLRELEKRQPLENLVQDDSFKSTEMVFKSIREELGRSNKQYQDLLINQKKIESFCQENAIRYFKKALDNNGVRRREVPNTLYLVGELNRRLGNFEEALEYFERAKKKKWFGRGFKGLVERQKAFAEAGDKENKSLEMSPSRLESFIYNAKEHLDELKYGCIEFSIELIHWLALQGYHAYMESQEGRPAGPGIIFYRIFRHLKPEVLERAKESYPEFIEEGEFAEWWDKGYRHFLPEEATKLKAGDVVYFSPGYASWIATEEETDFKRIKEELNLDYEKPYLVEEVYSDSKEWGKVRIKVQGLERLFPYTCIGRK